MSRAVRGWVGFLLLAVAQLAQAAGDPRELIISVTEQTIARVEAQREEMRLDPAKLNALVRDLLLPHFDFEEMSRSTLGKYWRQATPEQQQRFVAAYRALLVRTYATALLDYSGEEVNYLPLGAPEGDGVTVRTEISQPGGLALPIHYRMRQVDDRWLVYDVAIEGVSLTANYRTTFAGEIRRTGIDPLIDSLERRNKEGSSG